MEVSQFVLSVLFLLSLILLGFILVYESSGSIDVILFLLVYESMMLSMFLLVIMGKENLPDDVDFVALILVSMPAVVLLFSGTFLGVIADVLLIGGSLVYISRLRTVS